MSGSSPTYSLRELAERFGGQAVGDPETRIGRVSTLEAGRPGTITFLANPRYLHQVADSTAAAVFVAPAARDATQAPRLVHENPYLCFARISALLRPPRAARPGVHPTAAIDAGANVH